MSRDSGNDFGPFLVPFLEGRVYIYMYSIVYIYVGKYLTTSFSGLVIVFGK